MARKKPIISPLGQWAYPGEVTIIPSSNITMKGVNYPVLGIDDLGNQQMMMPGQDYTFPGNYVTEIPQMGKGGLAQWFDEKWVDVKTGKTCGRSGKDKNSRPYPACRPSKRVNETTPKTSSELSSAEKARFKREKTSGKRIDYNHKRREDGGETGWLDEYQVGGVRPPIYTSDLSKVRSYNDSNTLYNKTRTIENPKYYKGKSPSWYNFIGSTNETEAFAKNNNIDIYYTGKFPGKIQPVGTGSWGEGIRYPKYKKAVQPYILTSEIIPEAVGTPAVSIPVIDPPVKKIGYNKPVIQQFNYMSNENKAKALQKYGSVSDIPFQGVDINQLKNGGWLEEYQTGGIRPPIYTSNPRKVQLYQDSLNLYNKYQPSFDKYKNWTRLNNIQTASLQGNDLFNQYWGPNKPKGPSPYNENIIIKPVEEMMHHYLRPRSGVVGGFTHLYEKPGNNYLETKISDYLTPNPKQTYHWRAKGPDGKWLPYNVRLTASQIKSNAARKSRMWPVSVTKEDFLDLGLTGVTPDLNSVFRFKKPVQPYVYKKPEVVPDVVNTPVVEPPKPSLFVSNIDRDMYTPGGGMAREYNIGVRLQDGNRKSFRTEKEFQDWKAANNLDISKAKVTEGRGYSYDYYPENKKYGGWLNQYQDGGAETSTFLNPDKLSEVYIKPKNVLNKFFSSFSIPNMRETRYSIEDAAEDYGFTKKIDFSEIPTDRNFSNPNFEDAYNWTKKYMSSPRYRDMLQGKDEDSQIEVSRAYNLLTIPTELNRLTDGEINRGIGGYSSIIDGSITINPLSSPNFFKNAVLPHEISHSVDRPKSNVSWARLIPEQDTAEIRKRIRKNPNVESIGFWQDYGNTPEEGAINYFSDPTEVRARLNSTRKFLNKDFGVDIFNNKIKYKDLNKLKIFGNETGILHQDYEDLKSLYDEDDILWLLNNVSKTEQPKLNIAKHGGWLNQFQTGGWAGWTPNVGKPYMRTSPAGNAGYSDNTRVVNQNTNVSAANRKAAEAAEYAKRVGSISQGTRKSDYEKAREASSFVSQAERRKGSADPLDYVLDIFNPAAIGFAGVDLSNNLGSAASNTVQGNFAEAGSDLLGAGLNALSIIPAAAEFKGIVKPLSKFARLTPAQYRAAQQFANNSERAISQAVSYASKLAQSQINKNPRLALSLQRGRPISLDNVNTVSGIRYGDVSSVPNFNKIKPNTISEGAFFKQLEKGAGSLDNSLKKRVADLESEEGFRRLVDQEKDYLFYNSDLEEGALERVAKINARARIDELKNTRNINKEAAEFASTNFLNAGIPNRFVETSQLYDNAFRGAGYDDVLSNMLSKRQGINLVKATPNYSKSVPGEIGIGYNYVGNVPTEMHEIAHALQRGRRLSVDDQLRNIVPKKELTRDQKHAYDYFRKGSHRQEPSAFANELRESMLQSGIIPDYYSPISQQQIQDAYKYFKTKPMGTYNKNTGNFLSSTRILDFMAPNQSNSKLLSDILNKLPAVAPLAVGAAAASQLPEQKNGGWLNNYQDGGENLPELNSKIDIANFYKNLLSEKYGIYQDPTDKGYKYYLKSAEETNIPSKTFDFSGLNNIAKKINKKEIVSPEVIKYNSRIKDYTSDQDYLMESATKEFPIIPPSYEDVLSSIPKSETLNTIPKPKTLPNKQPVVNNTSVQNNFTFDSNYWSSPDIQAEIFNRQLKDNKWYGDFDKRGDNVLNRTDVKRNYDSEIFLQNLATPNSVVIDIGSALGNNNAQLAGVSVYELASNPKIKNKNIKVIATDIPSEVKGFEELKRRGNKVYPIDYAQVPETFNTPVRDILKSKNLENVKDVYLRAANSIDLLMNVQETSEHFKHISSSLKDKNVTYLYNNVILYKPAGSTKFKKLGNLNNSAFDHRAPTWKNNPNRNHYTLLPTNATGGQTGWLNKYK